MTVATMATGNGTRQWPWAMATGNGNNHKQWQQAMVTGDGKGAAMARQWRSSAVAKSVTQNPEVARQWRDNSVATAWQ